VVAGCGEDDLESKLGQQFPEVHLFEKQNDVCIETTLNSAIRLATGRYVALWDDDLLCRPDCLSVLLTFMDENSDVGVVGPRLKGVSGKVEFSCFRFPRVFNLFVSSNWQDIRNVHQNTPQEVDWLSSSAFVFRRETLDDVGFIDEGYGEHHTALDWCYRAKKAGWHTHYIPAAGAERVECSESNRLRTPVSPADWWSQTEGLLRFFRKKWLGV